MQTTVRSPSQALKHRQSLEQNKAYVQSSWVVWPTSKKVQAWDFVVAVALVYTVVLTPFQVAFLDGTPLEIFILNRLVDCCLVSDLVLQMFLVYRTRETSSRTSGTWVTNVSTIRWNYLKTWFLVDLVGLLSSLGEIADLTGGTTTRTTRFVQAVRFCRLFRLARPIERAKSAAIRMAGRLPIQVGFFASEFCAWLLKLVLIAHIVACVFGFTASLEGEQSWIKAFENNKNIQISRSDPLKMYLISLYWSFTILLTIGFGDVVPVTIEEHAVCIVVMVVGGLSWTILMATACSLAAAMDHERLQHGMNVETLVKMCSDHGLPRDLTSRLLHFLVKSRRMELLAGQQALMSKMSPSLQSEVSVHITERFLRRVDFFERSEKAFTVALASSLRLQIFPPKEWIVPNELASAVEVVSDQQVTKSATKTLRLQRSATRLGAQSRDEPPAAVTRGYLHKRHCPHLTMLEGGIAVLEHIRCSGSCWHKDLILSADTLRDQEVAQSIVFCSVYMLSRENLMATIEDARFPVARYFVRHAAIKLALVRAMTRSARLALESERDRGLSSTCVEVLGPYKGEDLALLEACEKQPALYGHPPVLAANLSVELPALVTTLVADAERRLQGALAEARQDVRNLAEQQAAMDKRLGHIASLLSALGSGRRSLDCEGPCWVRQVD